MKLDRDSAIAILEKQPDWDIVIIGGGATGLGTAVDAASRGYRTLLLEQSDFAKGTSSRSTKLVHGGVRYLANGDIALVYEALHERSLLFKNAAHLVHQQDFIIPCYSWFTKYKYLIGLKIYDLLAGKTDFKKSVFLSKEKVQQAIPGLQLKGLIGGICYTDGQFDDARLAINLAQTAVKHQGVLINYVQVTGLIKDPAGKVSGLELKDLESGKNYQVNSKVVVNATGVFVDDILKMDEPNGLPLVRPSQGAHIVLDQSFLNSNSALMIPKTSDGRVLFAVPWHGKVLVGTTDTPLQTKEIEPRPLNEEIDFILNTAGNYLIKKPLKSDILAAFAGLRPLAAPSQKSKKTKEISRSHKLILAPSQLITITGGKWTTYRKMAMDVLDQAIKIGKLEPRACITPTLSIHGSTNTTSPEFALYGTDAAEIRLLIKTKPELAQKIHPDYPYVKAEVVWAVENEMARNVEDVLARRIRLLFLDAHAACILAPEVASLMAGILKKDDDWIKSQQLDFQKLAEQYLVKS